MADKKDSKTVWVTFDTTLYFAQVFEENRDKADMHADTQGITKVTIEVTDEQEAEMLRLGVPATALGYETFKNFDIDGKQFRGYVAKRPWVSKYLKDEDGNPVVMGAPLVFDYNAAVEKFRAAGGKGIMKDEFITPWTIEDGLIGNGTKAKVKLSIYRGKNKAGKPTCVVNLEKIAITEHVPYENSSYDPDDVAF